MAAMTMFSEFAEEAQEAARQLMASNSNAVELSRTPGHFVATKGAEPEGSTTLQEFQVEGVDFALYTIA